MKEICIIPCGNKKIWRKFPKYQAVTAREAYIGTFHRLCKTYAHLFFDKHLILSAKHGFLRPDDEVEGSYNVSFSMNNPEVMTTVKLQEQVIKKSLQHYDRFVVLTGKKYVPILEKVMPNKELVFPLLHCKGIGYMQSELKQAIESNVPLHRILERTNS